MTKSGKKNRHGNNEATPRSDPPQKDPPEDEVPKDKSKIDFEEGGTPPPVQKVTLGSEVMSFLKGIGDTVASVQERMDKMEKRHSSRGAKRNARTGPRLHQGEGSKGPTKKLIDDFDDDVTDQTNPDWSEEEETMGKKERSQNMTPSSERRSVSVFDRVGKKLSEHDLHLKLEKITAEKENKRSQDRPQGSKVHRDRERSYRREDRPPSPRRERERSHHRDDGPPSRKDRKKDRKNDPEESSAPKKTQSHHASTGEGHKKIEDKEKVGDYKLDELKKALDEMNKKKGIFGNMGSSSPFTHDIRTAPLPAVFRGHHIQI